MSANFEWLVRALDNGVSFWLGFVISSFVLFFFTFLGHFLFKPISDFFSVKLQESLMVFLGIISSSLYILIIFVTMNVWGYLQETSKNSMQEASSLANLIELASRHTDKQSQQIVRAVGLYVATIRGPEWLAMSKGYSLISERKAWYALVLAVDTIAQDSKLANTVYCSHILDNLEKLTLYRNFRLQAIGSIVPPGLRQALIIFSVLVSLFLGIFTGKNNSHNIMAIGTFIVFLAFNLSLALMIDFPFSGISVHREIYYMGVLQELPELENNGSMPTEKIGQLP